MTYRCITCNTFFEAKFSAHRIFCSKECESFERTSHGKSYSKIYSVWKRLRYCCNDPQHNLYQYYGARGITYDPRWESFENFFADMGSTYQEGLTIERKDNNGPYTKDNCIWATMKRQGRNRRSNKLVKTPKGILTLIEVSEVYGIDYETLKTRSKRGWSDQRLLIPV